jgi:hypothetical protein
MHKRTLLTALAVAAITAIAIPATSFAQQPQPKESKGEVATAPSFSTLLIAIDSASARNSQLVTLTTLTAENVQLVNVDDLLQGASADSLTAALNKHTAAIDSLRATIAANTTINTALTSNTTPLASTDVVATDVTPDGKVIVYYWKKPKQS